MAKKSADLLSTTMLHWKFEPLSSESNDRRDLSSYMSPIGALANFLRELMQNVLDAGSRVLRLRWAGLPGGALKAVRLDEIAERARTSQGARFDVPDDLEDDHVMLVVEDEGCGLGGDYTRAPGPGETVGGFASYARGVGNSSKGAGDSGSKGIGRMTAPASSNVGTVYVHTNRREDGKDLFFGMSSLDLHSYRNANYRADGLLLVGDGSGGGPRSPAEGELARSMARAIGIHRPAGRCGTTMAIPALRAEFDFKAVTHEILAKHFLPILAGMLTVELYPLDSDDALVVDASTICDVACDPQFEVEEAHAVFLETVARALRAKETVGLDLGFPAEALRDGFIDGEALSAAASQFTADGTFCAKASFLVRRKGDADPEVGHITYCVASDPRLTCGADIKVRDGISVVKPLPGRPYVVVTITGRAFDASKESGRADRVAEMLRDGENPSHDQWAVNRMIEKGWVPDHAKLVNACFKDGGPALVNTLNRQKVEDDANAFADVFAFPAEDTPPSGAAPSAGRDARTKRPRKPKVANDDSAEGNDTPFETFDVPKDGDGNWGIGIAAKQVKRGRGRPARLTAVFGLFYMSQTAASAARKHTLADFDLRGTDFEIVAEKCDGVRREARTLVVLNPQPGFRMVVKGPFDDGREVEAVLEALDSHAGKAA